VLYYQGDDGTLRLQHSNLGEGKETMNLHSHEINYPDWGFGQQEVTVFAGKDDNDLWRVSEVQPIPSHEGDVIETGKYLIKTTHHAAGEQPAGWGLACFPAHGAKRNDHSSWVHVHAAEHWMCKWDIQPGTQPGTYRIYTCGHGEGGQEAGWGLSAWHAHGAQRNGCSSWVAVHRGDHWPMDWLIVPGEQPGKYRLLTTHHADGQQQAGWGLSAWHAHGAVRDEHSSRVAVHDGGHWPMDWVLQKVGSGERACAVPDVGVPFNLKLVSDHHGQPAGWYLDAHRFGPAERNHHSTWVLLHAPGNPSWAGEWVLEPGTQPETYKIKLLSSHHGQPAGWYLDVHRLDSAERNHHSTWVLVHGPGEDSWAGDFAFEPGATPNSLKIKLVSDHHRQPAGWYLDVHRYMGERNGHSSWALLLAPGDPTWAGDWVFEKC